MAACGRAACLSWVPLGSGLAAWQGAGRSAQAKHCSAGRGPSSSARLRFRASVVLLTPSFGSVPLCHHGLWLCFWPHCPILP